MPVTPCGRLYVRNIKEFVRAREVISTTRKEIKTIYIQLPVSFPCNDAKLIDFLRWLSTTFTERVVMDFQGFMQYTSTEAVELFRGSRFVAFRLNIILKYYK